MDKPKTYNEWVSSLQGFDVMRHANCCRISYEAGQQSRQAEIDELKSRIEGLESWIEGQIENLKCASKSWVYTEREKNIMLSQADDLKKALRGERE